MTDTFLPGPRLGSLPSMLDVLLRRLTSIAPLNAAEENLVQDVMATAKQHSARSELVPEGVLAPPRLLLAGWASRNRLLADGRRQIVSFILPGDMLDPMLRPRLAASCAAVALTAVTTVDASPLVRLAERADATDTGRGAGRLRLICVMDTLLLRDHIVRLGRPNCL